MEGLIVNDNVYMTREATRQKEIKDLRAKFQAARETLEEKEGALDRHIAFGVPFVWILVGVGVLFFASGLVSGYHGAVENATNATASKNVPHLFAPPLDWNEAGDYTRGFAGSVWSLAALGFVYLAFKAQEKQLLSQRQELLNSREELVLQRYEFEELTEQSKQQTKQFERDAAQNTFFRMFENFKKVSAEAADWDEVLRYWNSEGFLNDITQAGKTVTVHYGDYCRLFWILAQFATEKAPELIDIVVGSLTWKEVLTLAIDVRQGCSGIKDTMSIASRLKLYKYYSFDSVICIPS